VKNKAETAKVALAICMPAPRRAAAIETAVADGVTKLPRSAATSSRALYQDAEAFFAGIDKLASAKSINEASRSVGSRRAQGKWLSPCKSTARIR